LDIVNDGNFDEGDLKVVPFSVPVGAQATPEFVKLDGIMADVNCKISKEVP
jgi:hypothetical protein